MGKCSKLKFLSHEKANRSIDVNPGWLIYFLICTTFNIFSLVKAHTRKAIKSNYQTMVMWKNTGQVIALHCRYPNNNFSNLCASFSPVHIMHPPRKKRYFGSMTSFTAFFFHSLRSSLWVFRKHQLRLYDDRKKKFFVFTLWTFTFCSRFSLQKTTLHLLTLQPKN